ncbi:hypothetical protein F2Q69_00036537 [Brassica cretica]|uniref:Uncharacterized protein n=1 Tax=Brassica cretica TaxID=69181 RepID=A0A8S9SM35_BRACR|nr:hypothetical protein F2Q69_00036537 [Brassica cretica]
MTARPLGDFRVLGVDEQDTTMEDTGAGANPEKKEVKGDKTRSVEIGTIHDGSDHDGDFEEYLHDYALQEDVDVGSEEEDDGGVDIGVPSDFGEYHHDDGDYMDMYHMIHTHYPRLMSSRCLDDFL